MDSHTSVVERILPLGIIVTATSILLLWMAFLFWSHRRAQQELAALPTSERALLYQRTLATVRKSCLHPAGDALREFCREQAVFLSQFPDCDSECQRACSQLQQRPTK